ncbi:hypothetical protein E0Z06_04080 [Rheinheimera sp. D18]|uniref:hypothetical protein n=1 Tax=Rheinheimera sp. D18 TaxID=2545632 RepID=UPI001047E64E|nr:hypothetical protein [Rheinheimera sp. D18]QBL08748.1 hypothetical protein E0Z06_04080 [Rheinheimera sp. D18]
MRLTLIALIAMSAFPALAAPQYSQSECQKLNAKRLEVQKQLRQPYTAEQGKQLQKQQRELLKLLQLHCKLPIKDPPPVIAVALLRPALR